MTGRFSRRKHPPMSTAHLTAPLFPYITATGSHLISFYLWFPCRCRQTTQNHLICSAVRRWPLQQRTLTWAPAPMRTNHPCRGASPTQTASSPMTPSSQTTLRGWPTAARRPRCTRPAPVTNPSLCVRFWREASQRRRWWSWTSTAGWESDLKYHRTLIRAAETQTISSVWMCRCHKHLEQLWCDGLTSEQLHMLLFIFLYLLKWCCGIKLKVFVYIICGWVVFDIYSFI